MSIIFDWIVGALLEVLGYAFGLVVGGIYAVIGLTDSTVLSDPATSMVLGKEIMQRFFMTFPLMGVAFDAFSAIAHIIILALVINGMVKSLFGQFSKTAENPVILATRAAFASFLVPFSAIIAGFFVHLGSIIFIGFQTIASPEEITEFSNAMLNATGSNMAPDAATEAGFVVVDVIAAPAFAILLVFLLMFLISSFLKLALEVIERYITMAFLAIVSPLMVACLASASTTQYFFSWIKMMLSQAFLLGISSLWLNAFISALVNANNVTTAGDWTTIQSMGWIGFVLLMTSFVILGTKVDRHMQTLGFTAAQGGDFGSSLFQSFAATRGLINSGQRAISKMRGSNIQATPGEIDGSKIDGAAAAAMFQDNVSGNNKNVANAKGSGAANPGVAIPEGLLNNVQPGSITAQEKDGKTVFSGKDKQGNDFLAAFDKDKNLQASSGIMSQAEAGLKPTRKPGDVGELASMQAKKNQDAFKAKTNNNGSMINAQGKTPEQIAKQLQNAGADKNNKFAVMSNATEKIGDSNVSGHKKLQEGTLAAEGFDKNGNLQRFSRDPETGKLTADPEGDFIKVQDKDGNISGMNLAEIAQGDNSIAFGEDVDTGMFTGVANGQESLEEHRLAGGAIMNDENGGVLAETTVGGEDFIYSTTATNLEGDEFVGLGGELEYAQYGDDVVGGDISGVETTGMYKTSDMTLEEMNQEGTLNPYDAFDTQDLPYSEKAQITEDGQQDPGYMLLQQATNVGDITASHKGGEGVTSAGHFGAVDMDKYVVQSPDGNIQDLRLQEVNKATWVPTIGGEDARGNLGKRDGFKHNDSIYQFNKDSFNGDKLNVVQGTDPRTGKTGNYISAFNTSTRQNEMVNYDDIKHSRTMTGIQSTYGGIEVGHNNRSRYSDIKEVTQHNKEAASHLEIKRTNGTVETITPTSFLDAGKLKDSNYIEYSGGANNRRLTSSYVKDQLSISSSLNGQGQKSSHSGYVNYKSSDARRIFRDLSGQKEIEVGGYLINNKDIVSATHNAEKGVTIMETKDNKVISFVDSGMNPSYKASTMGYTARSSKGVSQFVELGSQQDNLDNVVSRINSKTPKERTRIKLKRDDLTQANGGFNIF